MSVCAGKVCSAHEVCTKCVRCALNVSVNMHSTCSGLYVSCALLLRCALNVVHTLHLVHSMWCAYCMYPPLNWYNSVRSSQHIVHSMWCAYCTPHVVKMLTTFRAHLTYSSLNVVCILHSACCAHPAYVVYHICMCVDLVHACRRSLAVDTVQSNSGSSST